MIGDPLGNIFISAPDGYNKSLNLINSYFDVDGVIAQSTNSYMIIADGNQFNLTNSRGGLLSDIQRSCYTPVNT